MKKIFLDTNFLIDYILRSEYTEICKEFLRFGTLNEYRFYISFLSVANFAYIARKLDRELLNRYLTLILELFEVIPNDKEHLRKAIELNSRDYEDSLQYYTAIDAGCEYIISRNKTDFNFSEIPVMTALEFLEINDSSYRKV